MDETEDIEPSFEFCWALSWRLILLSTFIGIMPLATVGLCFGVLGRAIPDPFNYLALFGSMFFVVIAAVAFALKILLSKNFKNASVKFVESNA